MTTLSVPSTQILDKAGFVADSLAAESAKADHDIRMKHLVQISLSTPEVAERLGVTAATVGHMLTERKLWAFTACPNPLFPPAQFTYSGMVPYLDRIVQLLGMGVHPLTVQALLTEPQQWLVADGNPVSIAVWLTWHAGSEGDISQAIDGATGIRRDASKTPNLMRKSCPLELPAPWRVRPWGALPGK